jgi:hypothetical protein
MRTRKKRGRSVGKLGVERGERYALIPEEVQESIAYQALPDWAKVVLVALACRYNGFNNGDLSLPFSEAKRLGVSAQWKLYAGLRLLERADLIVCTRRGRLERGTKLASLYALTWRGINAPGGGGVQFDPGVVASPIPSNAWAKWEKPADWSAIVKAVRRANHGRATKIPVSTTLGNGRSTTMGATESVIAQPRWGKESPSVAPNMVDTSKTPGLGARSATPAPAPESLLHPLQTASTRVHEFKRCANESAT